MKELDRDVYVGLVIVELARSIVCRKKCLRQIHTGSTCLMLPRPAERRTVASNSGLHQRYLFRPSAGCRNGNACQMFFSTEPRS